MSNQVILRDLVEERVFENFLRNFSLRTVTRSTKELVYDQAAKDKTAQSKLTGGVNRYVLRSPVNIDQNSTIEVTASRERHCSNASFNMEVVENNNLQKDDKIQDPSMVIRYQAQNYQAQNYQAQNYQAQNYQARKSTGFSELTVQKFSKFQNFVNSSGGRAKIFSDRYLGTEFLKGLLLRKDLGDRFVYQFSINQRLKPGEMIGIEGLDPNNIISVNTYTITSRDLLPKLKEYPISHNQYGSLDNKNSLFSVKKGRIIFRPMQATSRPTEIVEVTIHVSKRGLGAISLQQTKLELSVILIKPWVVIGQTLGCHTQI